MIAFGSYRPTTSVSAVLIALATGVGFVPSSYGQFDRVIAVPPRMIQDNAVIRSRTQVNVVETGTTGCCFDLGLRGVVNENIELNVLGGSVGGSVDAYHGSFVNLFSGSIGFGLDAFAGSRVNVSGGMVGGGFDAMPGSIVNVSGGFISSFFGAHSGSIVRISGGAFGRSFQTVSGSEIIVSGSRFRLNGRDIDGLSDVGDIVPIHVPRGSVLTGVLADGTPFVFTSLNSDAIAPGTLSLKFSEIPPPGPQQILASTDDVPLGIRDGQVLVVDIEGKVGESFVAGNGGTVQVTGDGAIGENLKAVGANIEIDGGLVGPFLRAFEGSRISLAGGSAIESARIRNSRLELMNGSLFDSSIAGRSTLVMTGGNLSHTDLRDSDLILEDGAIGNRTVIGGRSSIMIRGGTVGTEFAALQDTDVVLDGGTVADHFAVFGRTHIIGGAVGNSFSAREGSHVIISGGTIGSTFTVHGGSVAMIDGGAIGDRFQSVGNVRISDGEFGNNLTANDGTELIILGGSIGNDFEVRDGSRVTIGGGSFGTGFGVGAGGELNLLGTEFLLDGSEISNMRIGEPFPVVDRGIELSGVLLDGSPFSFYLNPARMFFADDFFDPQAALTLTLAGQSQLPGDYNANGAVDQGDLDLVLLNWGIELFNPFAAGWTNDLPDATVDQNELDRVLLHWGNSAEMALPTPVPEPNTELPICVLIVLLWAILRFGRSPGFSSRLKRAELLV